MYKNYQGGGESWGAPPSVLIPKKLNMQGIIAATKSSLMTESDLSLQLSDSESLMKYLTTCSVFKIISQQPCEGQHHSVILVILVMIPFLPVLLLSVPLARIFPF
jgi:hypothetical protein